MNASFRKSMIWIWPTVPVLLLLYAGKASAPPRPLSESTCTALLFSPDGRYLLHGDSGGCLASFDVSRKKWVHYEHYDVVYGKEQRYVTSVACFPDGKTAVSAGLDSKLRYWDIQTGKLLRSLQTGSKELNSVSVSGDGKLLMCAERDALVLRDTNNGKEIRRFPSGNVTTCAISTDGKFALTGKAYLPNPDAVVLWDVATGKAIRRFPNFEGSQIFRVAFSSGGKQALCAGGGVVSILELQTGKVIRCINPSGSFRLCESACFTPTARYVLTGCMSEPPRLWEVATGKVALELKHMEHWGRLFAISPDGRLAASAGNQHTPLVLWDLRTGQAVWSSDGSIGGR